MKKLVVSVLMLTVGFAVQAQEKERKERPSIEQRAQKQMKNLDEQVDLSAEQEAKVLAINTQALKEQEQVKNQGELTQDQAKAKMKEINKAKKTKIMEVLTPEQMKKLKDRK